jgi:hypothetical protein
MKYEIKYRKIVDENGEYYLPDFGQFDGEWDEPDDGGEEITIGKYGYMRLDYLKEHKPVLFRRLQMRGELRAHLAAVDREAREYAWRVVPETAAAWGATEQVKRADPMKWVGLMNSVRAAVDEIIIAGIICV